MSEFFLCEIENIAKSGVEIKVTGARLKKCDDDCIRTVRTVCFDFSEHDKVFEDKIAKLEKKNKDLESCFTQREQDSTDMIMELKRRIADLESKEDEKSTKYTTVIVAKEINGQEYVRLEDFMSVVNDLQAEIGT